MEYIECNISVPVFARARKAQEEVILLRHFEEFKNLKILSFSGFKPAIHVFILFQKILQCSI